MARNSRSEAIRSRKCRPAVEALDPVTGRPVTRTRRRGWHR